MASCSDEIEDIDNEENGNGGNPITVETIVGTWKCVAYEGYDSDGEWNEIYDNPNEYWGFKFNTDGTGLDFEYYKGVTDAFEIEWTLSDNKLTLAFYDVDYYVQDEYEVEKLTSSELIIVEYWESEDGSDKEMEKYTYKKIADL